jgi:transcriptional regulator with XRE-family HTH domain
MDTTLSTREHVESPPDALAKAAMDICERTRARLKKHTGHFPEICRLGGLSYSSVTKFAHGQADNPTIETLMNINEALNLFERGSAQAKAPAAERDPDAERIEAFEAPP